VSLGEKSLWMADLPPGLIIAQYSLQPVQSFSARRVSSSSALVKVVCQ
jgi:hypothetical protein